VIVVVGTVTKIESLRGYAGPAIVVDVDPRFAVTVHVTSIVVGTPPWSGSDPTFAIHSPSRTFQAADPIRGAYELRLERDADAWTLTARSRE
jgi:hypothetical protein